MAKSRTRKVHEPFESMNTNGKFAKICADMMSSKAWKKLSLAQQGLYLLLKGKFIKNNTKGTDNRDNISLPKSEWSELYNNNYRTFSRDIDALIDVGLIRVVQYQQNLRKPTIYGFSEKWKLYGTDKFHLDINEQRPKNTLTEGHREALSKAAAATNSRRKHKSKDTID